MAARVRRCVPLAGVYLCVGAPRRASRGERVTCVTIRTERNRRVGREARCTGDARNMQAPWFQNGEAGRRRGRCPSRGTGSSSRAGTRAPRSTTRSRRSRSRPPRSRRSQSWSVAPGLSSPADRWRSAGCVPLRPRWRPSWSGRPPPSGARSWCWPWRIGLPAGRRVPRRAPRQPLSAAMELYAERFVEEFERPLLQRHLVAPSHF